MWTDRRSHEQTGITKLIVVFRNFANKPKKVGYDGNRAPLGEGAYRTDFSI